MSSRPIKMESDQISKQSPTPTLPPEMTELEIKCSLCFTDAFVLPQHGTPLSFAGEEIDCRVDSSFISHGVRAGRDGLVDFEEAVLNQVGSLTPEFQPPGEECTQQGQPLALEVFSCEPTSPDRDQIEGGASGYSPVESQSKTENDETSPRSSNWSSPSSGSRSSPLTPQQRRQGSVFTKITFRTDEFSEERFIYSQTARRGDACLGLTQEENKKSDGSNCSPFFAIPTTRFPVSARPDAPLQKREDGHSGSLGGVDYVPLCDSRLATTPPLAGIRHSGCSFFDALIVALHDRTKLLPTLPGWEEELDYLLAQQDDPYWREMCTPELGTDDSTPLGHYPGALPSTLKRSPARAKGLTRRKRQTESATCTPSAGTSGKRTSPPKCYIFHPEIIASRADFQYWNSILDGRIMS
ncbi:hypothetical protein PCANC_06380 [Puccinia coronata f. sp. avenae]|uniref:Uncharacterized protein n=1 Tax=Puccinia coronata f. sp. avenae TaxID=200324 RepID=A0A2N5VVS2_9BASI|nr:hypothetical protein PCANC_06380 [Puccinia coronata f. sp. avenae]